MKRETMLLNAIFAVVLGVVLLVGMVWRVYVPNVVLAQIDIPAMAALSLIALLIEYFVAGAQKRDWLRIAALTIVTLVLLSWAAGYAGDQIRFKVFGTITFLVVTWLFDMAVSRLETTVDRKGAVLSAALGLYLACQCFTGMFL